MSGTRDLGLGLFIHTNLQLVKTLEQSWLQPSIQKDIHTSPYHNQQRKLYGTGLEKKYKEKKQTNSCSS